MEFGHLGEEETNLGEIEIVHEAEHLSIAFRCVV